MSKDRYELIKELGKGNFTEGVFLARHRDMGREVAIKLLATNRVNKRDELLNEARTMAALDPNANVVQVLDAGDWDDARVYIASELCRDGTLEAKCLTPTSTLDPGAACAVVSGVCRGLDFMHRQGLVHLDVRPANILFSDGVPKLGDFGLARWLTNASVPLVYVLHAAPEMLLDLQGTEASDQYATAMTLAHVLTGGAACATPPSPVTKTAWSGFPHLRDVLGLNVPDKLQKVMSKATAFDPQDRYKTIEDFKRALDRATPRVSFKLAGPAEMHSIDGDWAVEWRSRPRGWEVDVKRAGRRKSEHCASDLDESGARNWVKKFVTAVGYS